MKKRKLLVLFLVIIVCFSIIGCSGVSGSNSEVSFDDIQIDYEPNNQNGYNYTDWNKFDSGFTINSDHDSIDPGFIIQFDEPLDPGFMVNSAG